MTLFQLFLLLSVLLSTGTAFLPIASKKSARARASSTSSTTIQSETSDSNSNWGGDLSAEASLAASLVCESVRLCWNVQESLAIARGDTSLGTTATASAKGAADVKVDGTPVTAADFGIQGYISHALEKQFPSDRFMGEEDATDLRQDEDLMQNALGMANQLGQLTQDEFLHAVDRGIEPPRDGTERVWILDPIDGTKGLITGKQYIVGLALTVQGKAVVAVMGNPGVSPQVMVAVKGHGLRYWDAQTGQGPLPPEQTPRSIPNNWHLNRYDFTKLVPDGESTQSFGWGSGSPATGSLVAGVDYPPYLLSRPMTVGSPLPFGPLCAPSEVCCGAQVKYFAVAQGHVAGFIQFQETSLKSWDHAPGILCVQESGGSALDGNQEEIIFEGREFRAAKGIVCCAKEANTQTTQRLLACVQQTDITKTSV